MSTPATVDVFGIAKIADAIMIHSVATGASQLIGQPIIGE